MSDDMRRDELNVRAGASPPRVFALVLIAGIALAMAWSEYVYARDFEKLGRHPPVVHSRHRLVVTRDTVIGRVAERVVPQAGVWGATAVFALPGLALLTATAWLLYRGRARSGWSKS